MVAPYSIKVVFKGSENTTMIGNYIEFIQNMVAPYSIKVVFKGSENTTMIGIYIEFIQNMVYAPYSIKVVFKGSENTAMIGKQGQRYNINQRFFLQSRLEFYAVFTHLR